MIHCVVGLKTCLSVFLFSFFDSHLVERGGGILEGRELGRDGSTTPAMSVPIAGSWYLPSPMQEGIETSNFIGLLPEIWKSMLSGIVSTGKISTLFPLPPRRNCFPTSSYCDSTANSHCQGGHCYHQSTNSLTHQPTSELMSMPGVA